MVELPEDLRNVAYVDTERHTVIWHFKNASDQYLTHVYILDAAFSMAEHENRMREIDFSSLRPYIVHTTLATEFVDASDQDWKPAPIPGHALMTLAQFKAAAALPKPSEGDNA